jgi:hypothetical protein
MSLSATLFGRDSAIHRLTNIMGLGIPGWLDKKFGPPETEGPRLSDLSVQTSTYGADIPRLYGTISVMGNVIQLENNKLKETVRKKKSGGKGGGGASEPTKTYSYSATFQLALCEGPIAGIRRMWCGDKLIYNAGSDDLETIIASNQAAKGWKLYLGTDDQMPDPRYEAEYGVGNVSANRGLAYIAFYDFKLADFSNTLQAAQFKVEVVKNSTLELQSIAVATGLPISPSSAQPRRAGQDGNGIVRYTTLEDDILYQYTVNGSSLGKSLWRDVSGIPTFSVECFHGQNAHCAYVSGATQELMIGDEIFTVGAGVGSFTPLLAGKVGNAIVTIGTSQISAGRSSIGVDLTDNVSLPFALGDASVYGGQLYICTETATTGINIYTVDIDISGVSPVITFDLAGSIPGEPRQCVINEDGIHTYSTEAITLLTTINTYSLATFALISSNSITTLAQQSTRTATIADGIINFQRRVDPRVQRIALLPSDGATTLDSVILSEVQASGLIDASDVDVSQLSTPVRGYRISGGSIRSSIEPLMAAFPFDVRAGGYQIEFLPRGQASVATIPWEDLGATSGDTPDDIFQQSREMDTQLPAKTVVKYLDAAREYAINEQFSERLNTEAVNKVERDLAIVLTADEAAGIAEMLNFLPWLERTPASFTLPPPYRYLEAGDVVTVVSSAGTYELRTTEVNETQDGRLECQAVPERAALYTPAATGSEGLPPAGTIGLAGESLFVPLDIPVIDETLQNAPGFVGVMTGYTNGWPGGLAVRSIDDGQTWADVQAYSGKATIGKARGGLPASSCTLIDQRSLTVDIISGELDSVTRDQMLSGVNYAAYGVGGRWEIVRFQSASLQGDGSYLVSGFVRGEKGTEWATGLHTANDYFVLLDDPDNAFIGTPVGSIAVTAAYRGVTSGASVDDATDVPFTYQGVNLECLSPVHAKGSRDGSSNFAGTFTRRSRLGSSWWMTGVEAPLGETTQTYEIDVTSGSTIVRTISVSTPTFAYSAADQTTDFGSTQSSITFRIYQISETVGRGYAYEVTL